MSPPAGLGDVQLVIGRQRFLDHDPPAGVTDDADVLTSSSRRMGKGGRYPLGVGVGGRTRQGTISAMNVVVCLKQIPDPANPGKLDPESKTLVREGKLIMDDSDSYGVEMALQLVGKAGGGEVTLVSMAPHDEVSGLRNALAMGAHKGMLVSDPVLQGTDALGTAKVLAAALGRTGSTWSCVPRSRPTVTPGPCRCSWPRCWGCPAITFAKRVEIQDRTVKVHRQTEAGYDEVECPLPALVTVTAGVVEPRYPSFKGIMAAKSKPVDKLTVADLGSTPLGRQAGPRQEIISVEAAEASQGGRDRRRRGRGLRADRRLPRTAQGHLKESERDMALNTIWVVAECPRMANPSRHPRTGDQGPRTGRHGRSRHMGRRAPPPSRRHSASYGAAKVHDVGDLGGALPGAPVGSALAEAVAGEGPDAILIPHTYDGRYIAARLSAKLDKPVLTNVTDLRLDGDKLVVGCAIFGGSLLVDTVFTGDGPALVVVKPKSFAPEEGGGGAGTVESLSTPDPGRGSTAPRSSTATSRSAPVPSSTRPTSSSVAA